MLVLSRREGETLVFPELDIVLQVAAIKGSTVRLGLELPSHITVLRGEIAETRRKFSAIVDGGVNDPSGKLMHRIRNWLQVANLRMQLIRRYLDADRIEAAAGLLQRVLEDFRMIEDDGRPRFPVATAVPVAEPFGPPPAVLPTGHHRALLVEDNANERQLLAGFLRNSGFQVETVGDGGAALDYLSCQSRPDFVLLDMVMPNCDGPTVLRRIRKNHALDHLKIFAVSGSSPANWNIPTGPDGVDRWFEKPVDPQFLVREINRELEAEETTVKPR